MRVDEYLRVEVELITFEWNSQKNCAFHLIVIEIHLIFKRKERINVFSKKKTKNFENFSPGKIIESCKLIEPK